MLFGVGALLAFLKPSVGIPVAGLVLVTGILLILDASAEEKARRDHEVRQAKRALDAESRQAVANLYIVTGRVSEKVMQVANSVRNPSEGYILAYRKAINSDAELERLESEYNRLRDSVVGVSARLTGLCDALVVHVKAVYLQWFAALDRVQDKRYLRMYDRERTDGLGNVGKLKRQIQSLVDELMEGAE